MVEKFIPLGTVCLILAIAGCGQTGKLYLPDKKLEQTLQSH